MNQEKGTKVTVEYEGKLEDGTIFDSSEESGNPLEFELGAGEVIPGFEEAVMKMNVGETVNVKIDSINAYGPHLENLIQKIPKEGMPENVKEGMTVIAQMENGIEIPIKILKIDEKSITIDMNHPLAGKNLNFKTTLKETM